MEFSVKVDPKTREKYMIVFLAVITCQGDFLVEFDVSGFIDFV